MSSTSISTPTSTTFEFSLNPYRGSLEDVDTEPGSAISLAFSFEIPDNDLQPELGSPIYMEDRVHRTEDLQEMTQARAKAVAERFGIDYACDFGDCTAVLPTARALTFHLHIHNLAMELPEARGLPQFYTGSGNTIDLAEYSRRERVTRNLQAAAAWSWHVLCYCATLLVYIFRRT